MKKYVIILVAFSFLSCDDIIEVQDISNDSVTVLAPTNNAVLSNTVLTFSWEALQDAEHYHLQIATPTFAEAIQIVRDSTLTETSFSTTLENSNYEWRIRAENSNYVTEYTTQNFSIED